MLVRNQKFQRLIAVLLVTLVAVSSQAWASHVDWPISHGNDRAHVDRSELDDAQSLHAQAPAQSDSGDHCSHAAAHLMGISSDGTHVDVEVSTQYLGDRGERYTSPAHLPLTEPPIV